MVAAIAEGFGGSLRTGLTVVAGPSLHSGGMARDFLSIDDLSAAELRAWSLTWRPG